MRVERRPSVLLQISAGITGAMAIISALCAIMTLYQRLGIGAAPGAEKAPLLSFVTATVVFGVWSAWLGRGVPTYRPQFRRILNADPANMPAGPPPRHALWIVTETLLVMLGLAGVVCVIVIDWGPPGQRVFTGLICLTIGLVGVLLLRREVREMRAERRPER